jgi:hypothetical protein
VNTASAQENQEKIVAGVDGSGHSGQALIWAAREAKLRAAALEVIYAFRALVSLVGSTAHEYYPQVEKEAPADDAGEVAVTAESVGQPGRRAEVDQARPGRRDDRVDDEQRGQPAKARPRGQGGVGPYAPTPLIGLAQPWTRLAGLRAPTKATSSSR